jgi:SAM-dependent methyltransferase
VNDWVRRLGRRFARFATTTVVAHPRLWWLFRRPLRRQFGSLAPHWETIRGPHSFAPVAAAIERLGFEPRKVLDLGTGTGIAARLVAERFPGADVTGVDLAPAMIEEARALIPADAAGRMRFEVADATRLAYPDGEFDLVTLLNMIPFFGELARVTAPGGAAIVAFGAGPETPIYVPRETLEERLATAGFERFEWLQAGTGEATLAYRCSASADR